MRGFLPEKVFLRVTTRILIRGGECHRPEFYISWNGVIGWINLLHKCVVRTVQLFTRIRRFKCKPRFPMIRWWSSTLLLHPSYTLPKIPQDPTKSAMYLHRIKTLGGISYWTSQWAVYHNKEGRYKSTYFDNWSLISAWSWSLIFKMFHESKELHSSFLKRYFLK